MVKAQKNLLNLDVKWKHKYCMPVAEGLKCENDLFRGKTCVEWAQVEGSDIMYGDKEAHWAGHARIDRREAEHDMQE